VLTANFDPIVAPPTATLLLKVAAPVDSITKGSLVRLKSELACLNVNLPIVDALAP
jgi:hypothetical protein